MTHRPRYLNSFTFDFVDRGGGFPIWWMHAPTDVTHTVWRGVTFQSNPKYYSPWLIQDRCIQWAIDVQAKLPGTDISLYGQVMEDMAQAFQDAEAAIYEPSIDDLRMHLDRMVDTAYLVITNYIVDMREARAGVVELFSSNVSADAAAMIVNTNYLIAMQ